MAPNTRLLVIESVLSPELPQEQRQRLGLLDMQMLAVSGGRERDETAYAQLLTDTGFRVLQIMPTSAPPCIIEAIRI